MKFYVRLRKAGLKFCGIELGNEQYLPKFAESKITVFCNCLIVLKHGIRYTISKREA